MKINLAGGGAFLTFCIKFLMLFILFYLGTKAIIGLAAPGNLYVSIIDKYFNYIQAITISLIKGVSYVLGIFGIDTEVDYSKNLVKYSTGRGVIVSLSCVGYGVYSFWVAFTLSYNNSLRNKILWIIFGLLLLWSINVARISLFLTAINKGWPMPFGLDHHTLFNIAAYSCIFVMMYFFTKEPKKLS